jgi:hypothetical protein
MAKGPRFSNLERIVLRITLLALLVVESLKLIGHVLRQ